MSTSPCFFLQRSKVNRFPALVKAYRRGMADSKASFLGSLSPWVTPRPSVPKLGSDTEPRQQEPLRQSTGDDHAISLRPSPSLRRYPRDCPPLKSRWFYAVDVPKRKPLTPDWSIEKPVKPPPSPKKLVPFSASDSLAIENAFQALDGDESSDSREDVYPPPTTKVPVNEDYLFDVNIEQREMEPAYWVGPVYEVRRGSWFYQDSTGPRPCDENLANQLEEGYLKVAPWRKSALQAPRSSSQPRSRPSSIIADASKTTEASASTPSSPKPPASETQGSKSEADSGGYRLFGTYMNTTVTYQDGTTAWLVTDDFMSRMSSTMYSRFGGLGGTKVTRGFTESGKPETVEKKVSGKDQQRRGKGRTDTVEEMSKTAFQTGQSEESPEAPREPRPTALQRQLSSLAGAPGSQSSEELAEEARRQEEKEMEDARETDADEQGREIDNLILVTHGVGQRLGLRLDSINFIHDVNTMRKTMKAVYASAPDLQALNSHATDSKVNCRIQILPICWRHLLDFPKQTVRENRKEHDLGVADCIEEDEYPNLADITVDGVPAVRNLITDLAMDVLLYQSAYRGHIAGIVQRECNRVYKLFKQRNPTFAGRVSLCGHSLGSAIMFDILCRQKEPEAETGLRRRVPSKSSREKAAMPVEQTDLQLDFPCDNFFCLGSPIALFQMLKGRTIRGRKPLNELPPESPFDPDPMVDDPFVQSPSSPSGNPNALQITISSPKCGELFNIFHPTDPIAYRLEPLISPAMASLKSQPLPYTKKGLFDAPGIANIGVRVGQSVGSMWNSLTSGVASSLINRSLGLTGEDQALPQDAGATNASPAAAPTARKLVPAESEASSKSPPVADERKQQALADAALSSPESEHMPTLIDSELETLYTGFQKRKQLQGEQEPTESEYDAAERARKVRQEEAKVRLLNSNGRVDYSIQESMFDISLLASIASHLSYWGDEDVNHFMIGQILKRGKGREGSQT